ncbi:MAG: hypothetical protein JWM83_1922 [Candidatus Angelobacter sp.]|nr:hypothetical protein [Candidatus Angelobacter sp.]
MRDGGAGLRKIREELGITLREARASSLKIAGELGNPHYCLSLSRLSEIENKGVLPNIYRLYTLSRIYRRSIHDLLQLYGLPAGGQITGDLLPGMRNTHVLPSMPSFDPPDSLGQAQGGCGDETIEIGRLRTTGQFGQFLEEWRCKDETYGYVGDADYTMYPIISPGSVVKIDRRKDRVAKGPWKHEHERPIYFVELRDGFACCWCDLQGSYILLQPHPLSPRSPRLARHPQDAEVLGQVVAVAMRVGYEQKPGSKTSTRPTPVKDPLLAQKKHPHVDFEPTLATAV